MKYRFNKHELEEFLLALDRNLPGPVAVAMIGEAVAILEFGVEGLEGEGTVDIDFTSDFSRLLGPIERAREETGLSIVVDYVSVHEPPWNYDDRMHEIDIPGLKYLQIFAPEKHDWVLMKTARLSEKDILNIREVHEKVGLNADVLIERFQNEMTHVTGRGREVLLKFLLLIEELYGPEEREGAKDKILAHPPWRERLEMEGDLGEVEGDWVF